MPVDIGGGFQVRTRAEWGATFNYESRQLMQLPATETWVHHTVTAVTSNPDADARQVEQIGIARFGIPSYSFLIHPAGIIYQLMDDRQGAHTVADKPGWSPTNRNPFSHGIAFVGDYTATRPTAWQTEAAGRLIWFKRNVERSIVVNAPIRGHRECKFTACPGDMVYNRLDTIRQHAATPPPTDRRRPPQMPLVVKERDGAAFYLLDGGRKIKLLSTKDVNEAMVPLDQIRPAEISKAALDRVPLANEAV